jgi:hypothetical protein
MDSQRAEYFPVLARAANEYARAFYQGRGFPQLYPGPLMKRVTARVSASVLAACRTLAGTHHCG